MRQERGATHRRTGPAGAAWGRTLPLAGLITLTLLPDVGLAADPVWCRQVRRGDTLSAIARRYHTTVRELRRVNSLGDSVLRAGITLTLPALEHLRRGALKLSSKPLTATVGSLGRENSEADRQRLSRMRDLHMVRRFVRAGLLVPLPRQTHTYGVTGVPPSRRVARPWTKRFIEQLAAGLHGVFGSRLKVTSLTRTTKLQRSLRASNENAAPARRSTHLTGAAVDISKQPHTAQEIMWLRQVLRRLSRQGLLHAIEEFQQPNFHVMVFRRYLAHARKLPSPVLIGGC